MRVWRDRFMVWLAHRMPRHLVYWCAIRLLAHATNGIYSKTDVPELSFMEALQRWDCAHGGSNGYMCHRCYDEKHEAQTGGSL